MTSTDTTTEPSPTPPPARRGRRRLLLALAGLVVLLGALWVAGYALAGGRTPSEASVAGVDIGGLAPEEAERRVAEGLSARATAPLQVVVGGREDSLDPAAAGLSVDAAATVRATGTRSWDPVGIVRHLTGGEEVEPVVRVDDAALTAALEELAGRVAREPRDGGVAFDGARPVAVEPVTGVALDVERSAEVVERTYLRTDGPVELPARETQPAIDAADVEEALRTRAQPAVSAPVVLVSAGERFPVEPDVIAAATTLVPRDGELVLSVDGRRLKEAVHDDLDALEEEPQDASFRLEDGRPVVVPAVEGRAFSGRDLARAVTPALTRTGDERVAEVRTSVTQPDLTTAEARALGVTDELSSFTQDFPYAAYRVTNIGQAARTIDGTLLEPGETFSMNGTLGERTEANGYTTGTVISGGRYRQELGGGVSTITTAMWTAAFYAGLERVESKAHSLYISRYEAGLEATVSWPSLDLKFRNDTGKGVYIQAESGDDYVTITMFGTKRYDVTAESGPRANVRTPDTVYDTAADCTPQSGVDGFDITVTRVFRQGGEVVRREPITTSYNATDRIICGPRP
ncbi:VanW family protein [Vallicoccus soli]|uniref:VanW family protein n=1 Tax=Vallicoccus soli TaxID=2339232 RepID=UPI001401DA5B|nr:VanW family protein [Vallicoccus soli]